MKIFTHEEILERYRRLPQALRDAMFADVNTDIILELGKKHSLLVDRVGLLADETAYIMLGLVHPKEFVSRLVSRLDIPEDRARALAADVNERVFNPIRKHLLEAHDFSAESIPEVKKSSTPEPAEVTPGPSFRQPSFAMPMQTQGEEKPAFKAPAIFTQKFAMKAEEIKKPTGPDPYREPI